MSIYTFFQLRLVANVYINIPIQEVNLKIDPEELIYVKEYQIGFEQDRAKRWATGNETTIGDLLDDKIIY